MSNSYPEELLNKLCTNYPMFDSYVATKDYLVNVTDQSVEVDIRDIIRYGFHDIIVPMFESLGVNIINYDMEIFTNLYDIERFINLYSFIEPKSLTTYLSINPDICEDLCDMIDGGHIEVTELLTEYLKILNDKLGNPPMINEAISIFQELVNNTPKFRDYFELTNTQFSVEELDNSVDTVTPFVKHLVVKQRELLSTLQSKIEILPFANKDILRDIITAKLPTYLSDIIVEENRFIRETLYTHKYDWNKINSSLVSIYLESSATTLVLYIKKRLLTHISENRFFYLLMLFIFDDSINYAGYIDDSDNMYLMQILDQYMDMDRFKVLREMIIHDND